MTGSVPSISHNVVVMTREELRAHEDAVFQRGVERGRFEERTKADPALLEGIVYQLGEAVLNAFCEAEPFMDMWNGLSDEERVSLAGSVRSGFLEVLGEPGPTYQHRVVEWLIDTFGEETEIDKEERGQRFIEEALEAVQAAGMPKKDVLMLVEYVYGRPAGDLFQEIGGVMVTAACMAWSHKHCMHTAGEVELSRIWSKQDAVRAKQATKPKGSPLPGTTAREDRSNG